MEFSYKLLSELVDLKDIDIKTLVDKLTFSGFEVESYHQLGYGDHLVIGQIKEVKKHPDSDHLHLLKVDVGSEVLDIVCGAPNVDVDKKVIVALDGANLPAINKVIKAGLVRNYQSNGMCCSLSELGVSKISQTEEELNGIYIFDDYAKVGDTNVLKYLNLDDYVLDINILPNRPDCLSHYGLAREISCLFNRKLYDFDTVKYDDKKSSYIVSSSTSKCDLFNFLEFEIDPNKKIPSKIKQYLNACGIRSVSYIVDIGNFIMLVTGQPVHMYDLDKVHGNKLTVKDDVEQEFIGLDDKSYNIHQGDLVIVDDEKICCLGGVMGAKAVAVNSSSKHIGIELAHFYHANIRHTCANLGLSSDSSALFIKGVNPYLNEYSSSFVFHLLDKIGASYKYLGNSNYSKINKLEGGFSFSLDKLNSFLGSSFDTNLIKEVLSSFKLEYDLDEKGNGNIKYNKYRLDLLEQCDICEEIYRTHIDEKYYVTDLTKMPVINQDLTSFQKKEKIVINRLVNCGLSQIISFTLISKEMDSKLRVFTNAESYKLLNPITEEHEYVRSDLLSSMYQVLKYNLDRKHENLALFEISDIDNKEFGHQKLLSIGLSGLNQRQEYVDCKPYDFYDMKGIVETVLYSLGLDSKRYNLIPSKNDNFHPNKSADIFANNIHIGTFGYLSPLKFKDEMLLCELNLSAIFELKTSKFKCKPISLLQPIRRDLAFKILDKNVTYVQILSAIKASAGKYISDVKIFDIFSKDNELSYAFAIYLIKEDKSFTDAEINEILNKIITDVTKKLKVELKG